MNKAVLDEVERTAERLEGCSPIWLKDKVLPEFETQEEGAEGPQMVLLHGLFGAMSNWDGCLPAMAKFARVTALRFPILSGHRSEVKVKALAAYTEAYIRTKQIAPVTLCGNSLGGHVALRMALASPELVDCLVLSGSSGLYEHSVDSLPVRPDEKFIRDHMKRVFYNPEFITDEAVHEVLGILKVRMNHLNLIHAARSAKKDNLLKYLKLVKAPTLLLWGEDDEVTTMDVARIFEREIPNSKLITIKNCGHAPMIEYPEWFADQVEPFLREHSQAYRSKQA